MLTKHSILTYPATIDAVRYSAERLVKLGQTAAAPDSPFSLSDRIGLVWDAFALAKAGYAPVSSAFGLISMLRDEKECKLRSCESKTSVLIRTLQTSYGTPLRATLAKSPRHGMRTRMSSSSSTPSEGYVA